MAKCIKIELLSPAKDLSIGKAAIDAGADAVYIGAPIFSARQAAGNSIEDISKLCRYAHQFSAKVLVALNTLLTKEERRLAVEMIWQIYHTGADALIIQDLNLLNENLPPICLHASTQCDNLTADDVLARERDGFKRVVLARELSIDEIRQIRQQSQIELEAFVHGALCVSYSGCCYMSERVTGRSANRGNCAQLCRWQYDILDRNMNELVHQKYVLSLRDLDRSKYIRELLDAGITTLKIEGRLKDEAYVKNITAYYRWLLDRLFSESDSPYCKASKGNVYHDFTPNPQKTFHRSETDYFLHGRTFSIANWNTPKSTGEYIGKVSSVGRNYIDVETDIELHNGDGLCFGDKGFMINRTESLMSAKNRTHQQKTGTYTKSVVRIYPNIMPLMQAGSVLYRNLDIEFNKILENSHTVRKIPVDIVLSETDTGFKLRIGEKEQCFDLNKTPANNTEQALQNIRKCLTKIGDTPFEVSSVTLNLSQSYFIPASQLNLWRRSVIDEQTKSADSIVSISEQIKPIHVETYKAEQLTTDPLMTCRYCILYEMNLCRKIRKDKNVAEPEYLRSGKHLFRLHFDCQLCRMTITEA